jgi:hypothetical protein|tara:strand:- start:791 stop:1009 length:219 start_codon:yes stop_codon:yes gene_type:complete
MNGYDYLIAYNKSIQYYMQQILKIIRLEIITIKIEHETDYVEILGEISLCIDCMVTISENLASHINMLNKNK